MSLWQQYSDKFQQLSMREQYIIVAATLFLIIYLTFTLVIADDLANIKRHQLDINSMLSENESTQKSIIMFEQALKSDPNKTIKAKLQQQKNKLVQIDEQLLALTSELINPIQMRKALVELLSLERNVSLVLFEVMAPKALYVPASVEEKEESEHAEHNTETTQNVGLYHHGIQLKLKGRYQDLQTYLKRLEQLKWTFFWQNFELNVVEYPNNELTVTIYSLSTKRDFIGV